MSALELQFWPAEVLRTPAKPVTEFDDELRKLLVDMAETMYLERGIGLAAPQVAISKRILVMDVPSEDSEESNLVSLINPEIVATEGEIWWDEGCLSFPGVTVEVKRHERVQMRYQDQDGAWQEMDASGLTSICLQHELDHLNGVTFVDYLSPLKRKLVLRDLKKTLVELGVNPSA